MTDLMLAIVRRRLIDRFKAEQASSCEYLSFQEVADKWAYLKKTGATIAEEKERAASDLMEAAFDGDVFPELFWIVPEASVELLPCFDRGMVEQIADELQSKTGEKIALWTEPENTTLMTSEKFSLMRTGLGLREIQDRYLRERFKDCLWAPKEAVVRFLIGRGVERKALPSAWLALTDQPSGRASQSPEMTKKAWHEADEPHFERMIALLENGSARSVAEAARSVVATNSVWNRNATKGSVEKRLARDFSKWKSVNSA